MPSAREFVESQMYDPASFHTLSSYIKQPIKVEVLESKVSERFEEGTGLVVRLREAMNEDFPL